MSDHLGDRKLYLGSSDAATALGLSPWKTSHELWTEKQPGFEVVREDNPLFERGHKMEDVMVDMLMDRGRVVDFREREFVHCEYDWLKCHVDGIMPEWTSINNSIDKGFTGPGLLEMKAPGSHRAREFNTEGMAKDYLIQGQLNMYLSGCKWGSFVYLDYDKWELKVLDMFLDVKLVENEIIPKLVEFWDMVAKGKFIGAPEHESITPPSLKKDKYILDDDAAIELGIQYAQAKELLKKAKAVKDELEGEIKGLVIDHEKSSVGCIDISWKHGKRTSYKGKNLLALAEKSVPDFDRSLYVTEKDSRTFRATVRSRDE